MSNFESYLLSDQRPWWRKSEHLHRYSRTITQDVVNIPRSQTRQRIEVKVALNTQILAQHPQNVLPSLGIEERWWSRGLLACMNVRTSVWIDICSCLHVSYVATSLWLQVLPSGQEQAMQFRGQSGQISAKLDQGHLKPKIMEGLNTCFLRAAITADTTDRR